MKKIALYIHIPFCKSKCLYCDFPSFCGKESLINDYVDSLIKEINNKATKYLISSLFIGGGTPSYLDENNLRKLLKCLNSLNYIENAEKTIECNPGTLSYDKLKIIKKYGINRLSFGLQSTNNDLLKSIGRMHTFEDFMKNYDMARNLGFSNINVDMMFGLPSQTVDMYFESLYTIMNINPEHISCYSLIVEENTPFYNLYNQHKIILPSEDDERTMYEKGIKILSSNGYKQYEISNFSKPQRECIHNIAYWKCFEYLGIGAYASSYINNMRLKNISSIEKYIEVVNNNLDTYVIENRNTVYDNMEEFMFMGLRMLEGISKKDFYLRFNKSIYEIYNDVIISNVDKKLLVDTNDRISLTPKGIELSNEVMSDFIF